MQHVSLDRSLLIRGSPSAEPLWAAFLKKAASKYPKVVVLLFECLEADLKREFGSALPPGIVFVECFNEALEVANLLRLLEQHAGERILVAVDSLDHHLLALGVNRTARFIENVKELEIPIICRTTSKEKALNSLTDAILEVSFDVEDPELVLCHSTCFQKNGKRVVTTESWK
uniref:Regulator n=1 Tax=Steinernema glaseri TaxID=37863 RepID=A0A1I7ZTZ8_9BILA